MRDFVLEALATGLNFSGLKRVNSKFYIGHRSARRRESDIIWKLPPPKGPDRYLYLLFEFQSKNDWWNAAAHPGLPRPVMATGRRRTEPPNRRATTAPSFEALRESEWVTIGA